MISHCNFILPHRKLNNAKGFTLVEMVVCISIIALLISFVIPSFQKTRVLTRIVLCESNMKQQGIMIAQYASDCHDFIPHPVTTHGIMANLKCSPKTGPAAKLESRA